MQKENIVYGLYGTENLTVLELTEERDTLSYDELIPLLIKRPSNVIYIEFHGRLYGIITMGRIALVKPCSPFEKRMQLFSYWREFLEEKIECVEIIEPGDIPEYLDEVNFILFVDAFERPRESRPGRRPGRDSLTPARRTTGSGNI